MKAIFWLAFASCCLLAVADKASFFPTPLQDASALDALKNQVTGALNSKPEAPRALVEDPEKELNQLEQEMGADNKQVENALAQQASVSSEKVEESAADDERALQEELSQASPDTEADATVQKALNEILAHAGAEIGASPKKVSVKSRKSFKKNPTVFGRGAYKTFYKSGVHPYAFAANLAAGKAISNTLASMDDRIRTLNVLDGKNFERARAWAKLIVKSARAYARSMISSARAAVAKRSRGPPAFPDLELPRIRTAKRSSIKGKKPRRSSPGINGVLRVSSRRIRRAAPTKLGLVTKKKSVAAILASDPDVARVASQALQGRLTKALAKALLRAGLRCQFNRVKKQGKVRVIKKIVLAKKGKNSRRAGKKAAKKTKKAVKRAARKAAKKAKKAKAKAKAAAAAAAAPAAPAAGGDSMTAKPNDPNYIAPELIYEPPAAQPKPVAAFNKASGPKISGMIGGVNIDALVPIDDKARKAVLSTMGDTEDTLTEARSVLGNTNCKWCKKVEAELRI